MESGERMEEILKFGPTQKHRHPNLNISLANKLN